MKPEPIELENVPPGDGLSADGRDKLYAGDVITIAGVYKVTRWWQFWHWFREPKPQHKLFVVQEPKP